MPLFPIIAPDLSFYEQLSLPGIVLSMTFPLES